MADECDEEWLSYSSCQAQNTDSVDVGNEEEQEESPGEDPECDNRNADGLEKICDVFKRVLCNTSSHVSLENLSLISADSQTDELCNHQIWLKLVSKLNSIRQPKWTGSRLEDYYYGCLRILKSRDPNEPLQVTLESLPKNLFDFHGMKLTYSSSLSEEEDVSHATDLESELVDKNVQCNTRKLSLSDSTSELRDNLSPQLNGTYEEFVPELEWSDNDVKDESTVGSLSATSAFDESEAAADLAKLPYEEIIQVRNELLDHTKRYSDVLVIQLKDRDAYIREKELKNNFISSFLAVQSKIREATSASNKKKFSLQSNSTANNQSLTITIPYEIQNGGPGPDILEKLIEIMEAMRSNSPNVPTLLTNYILKVGSSLLNLEASPQTEGNHPFAKVNLLDLLKYSS